MLVLEKKMLDEDEYRKVQSMSSKEFKDYVVDIAIKAGYHPAGYGLYNARLIDDENGHYIAWKHGRSCD